MNERIRTLVDNLESQVVDSFQRYEEGRYSSLSEVARTPSTTATNIGLGHLAMGNCTKGREWLSAAATGYLTGFQQAVANEIELNQPVLMPRYVTAHDALRAAILSRDGETQTNVAEGVLGTLEQIPPELDAGKHMYPLCRVLAAFLLEVPIDDKIGAVETETTAESDELGSHRVEILTSIQNENFRATENAIQDYLDYHHEVIVDNPDFSEIRQLISFEAAAYADLATQGGLVPEIESDYLPECVFSECQ